MVLPAAQAHGPFIQHPQAGHGLARVQDHGLRAGHGIHEAPRHRRDARHALQEVQRHPLAGQDRLAWAVYRADNLAQLDAVAVGRQGREDNARVHLVKDPPHDFQPGHDAGFLGEKNAGQQRGLGNRVQRRHIAVADVLGQGVADDLVDLLRLKLGDVS